MDEKLEDILEDARTFYMNRRNNNQSISWSDYEYFKQRLHSANLYGYEYQIAEALHI